MPKGSTLILLQKVLKMKLKRQRRKKAMRRNGKRRDIRGPRKMLRGKYY